MYCFTKKINFMKENLSNEQKTNFEKKPIQEKIVLLTDFGFVWKEIAMLAKLPKKFIKDIGTGEFLPNDQTSAYLGKELDKLIERFGLINTSTCPEVDLDITNYELIKLEVKNVSLYKGSDDNQLIIRIHAIR